MVVYYTFLIKSLRPLYLMEPYSPSSCHKPKNHPSSVSVLEPSTVGWIPLFRGLRDPRRRRSSVRYRRHSQVGRRLLPLVHLAVRERDRVCVPGELGLLHLGVVVDGHARLEPGLDDGRVGGNDERLRLLGRVEHLAVALEAERAGALFAAVSLVEVDDESDEPCESDATAGDGP